MTEQEFLAKADKRLVATPEAIRQAQARAKEIGVKAALKQLGMRSPAY